jgi:hypothetical protein
MIKLFPAGGAGVSVPVMVIIWPLVYEDAPVWTVIVLAAKAAIGPRTRKAASSTVAMVLIVFISITW